MPVVIHSLATGPHDIDDIVGSDPTKRHMESGERAAASVEPTAGRTGGTAAFTLDQCLAVPHDDKPPAAGGHRGPRERGRYVRVSAPFDP